MMWWRMLRFLWKILFQRFWLLLNEDIHRKRTLWTNTGQDRNFQRTLSAIGPYEFRGKFIWTNHWSIPFPGEIRMDQWSWKFFQSFPLHWYWSMDGSSQISMIRNQDVGQNFWSKHLRYGTGGILFREYCFGRENSLSSAANSVSSAKNSVSLLWHTNNRLKGTHWVRSPETQWAEKNSLSSVFETVFPETVFGPFLKSALYCFFSLQDSGGRTWELMPILVHCPSNNLIYVMALCRSTGNYYILNSWNTVFNITIMKCIAELVSFRNFNVM